MITKVQNADGRPTPGGSRPRRRQFLASHKGSKRQRICARKGCTAPLRRGQCSVCSEACALAYMEQIADMYRILEDYDPARFQPARTAALAALQPRIDSLRLAIATGTIP